MTNNRLHHKRIIKHVNRNKMATLLIWEIQETSDYMDEYDMDAQVFVNTYPEYNLFNEPEYFSDLQLEVEEEPTTLPVLVVNGIEIEAKIPAGGNPIRRPRPTS